MSKTTKWNVFLKTLWLQCDVICGIRIFHFIKFHIQSGCIPLAPQQNKLPASLLSVRS